LKQQTRAYKEFKGY